MRTTDRLRRLRRLREQARRGRALLRFWATLPTSTDDRVLVDYRTSDDAGCVQSSTSGRALVQTVDFFTPVVDDPIAYGRIAGGQRAVAMSTRWAGGP